MISHRKLLSLSVSLVVASILMGCRETPAPAIAPAASSPAAAAMPTIEKRATTQPAPATAIPAPTEPPPTPAPPAPTEPLPTPAPPAPTELPPIGPTPNIDIIVDNHDPAFSTEGTWFIGDGGQSYNGDCAWTPRGIGNGARVEPELPVAGTYEIFGWWCGDPNHDQSRSAVIWIYLAAEDHTPQQVYVNLQEKGGQWNSLGTYWLEKGARISVASGLNGNVVADAFRFVYRSSEPRQITPTPLPTPIVWTNHPPSPLEQITSGDLSARLGLVQSFYQYTPITAMEQTTFDDCQAFPRDGCGGARQGWRVQVQYQDLVVGYKVSQDYHFVSIEPPEALSARQFLHLYGSRGDRFFRIDRYPDDTWHVSGANYDNTYAVSSSLDGESLATIQSLVRTYSTLPLETPDGIKLELYGLGRRVGLSEADRDRLATLAADMMAAVAPGP